MSESTRNILTALFAGDPALDQEQWNAIYKYAEVAAAGKDAARFFPATHEQIFSDEAANKHFRALQSLLGTPEQQWIQPPVDAELDFSFLSRTDIAESTGNDAALSASAPSWFLEAGRLVVQFTRESLDLLTSHSSTELAYAKSSREQTLFSWQLERPDDDYGLAVTARELDQAAGCELVVAVEIPSRGGWPHLANIPITLSSVTTPHRDTQTVDTDAFGKARFSAVPISSLSSLSLEVNLSEPEAI